MKLIRHCIAALLFVVGDVSGQCVAAGEPPLLDVALTVDFSDDVGQNRGSLFEVYDDEGHVVAGAGFLGAYNTQPRSNRRRLHFFLKQRHPSPTSQVLPRVNNQTGAYLSDRLCALTARSRNGRDTGFYTWDSQRSRWQRDPTVTGYDVDVAGIPLQVRDRNVAYDGQTILTAGDHTRICEHYYATGQLVLRLQDMAESGDSNRLIAVPWTRHDKVAAFDQESNPVQPLRSHREFAYAMGQLGDEILVATNTGGVYALKCGAWRVIVEPGPHSYQVYSMLNFYNRLLLGHYPSGELLEYDGHALRPLPGWPPVMPGVSTRAREAQTLAIYGGDLYAGVWPWAELWRYDRNISEWDFVRRMFTHPAPTDETTHPYENETAAIASVRNLWGQRVTSLVPVDESFYVATSSKSGTDSIPAFLSEEQWQEYGRVHQLQLPGQISTEIDWTEGPTKLRCLLTHDRMSLWQDDQLKAEQTLNASNVLVAQPARISWGRGVYGRLRGKLVSRESNLDRPFLGAYVKFGPVFDGAETLPEQKQAIDRMLDRFQDAGLQVVMPYVTNTSGQAEYPSQIIETHVHEDWDPLAHLIAEAKQRRLDVYPVICVLVCGHDHPAGVLQSHPEWAIRSPQGEALGFISPANADARNWVTSVIDEVVGKYNVSGILLDYLRYPNRPIRLDEESEAEFDRSLQSQSSASGESSLQSFRESALTTLCRQISVSARAIRPDLKIVIYSWGPHVASNHAVAQPWPVWSQEGRIDMVNISGYCYTDNYGPQYLDVFSRRISDSIQLNRQHDGRADVTFCLGVKTSHGQVNSAAQINEYLLRAAAEDVSGVVIFTWGWLQPFLDEVKQSGYLPAFVRQLEQPEDTEHE